MKLIINTDGGARGNPGPAGIGVVIADEAGNTVSLHNKYIGEATNNVAEYKALILALEEAGKVTRDKGQETRTLELQVNMDSELVVRQMQGVYKIKEPTLKGLADQAFALIKNFQSVKFVHVRREYNKLADKLVNEVIDGAL